MRLLHRRLLAAIALCQFMLLGWDSHAYWFTITSGDPFGWEYWFLVPLLFYVLSGVIITLIVTGGQKN